MPPSEPQRSDVCKRNGSVKLERNPTYRSKATDDQRAGGCHSSCVRSFIRRTDVKLSAEQHRRSGGAARAAGTARGRHRGAGVSYERVRAALLRPFPARHLRALRTPTPRNACLAPTSSTPWHLARLAAAKAGCAGVLSDVLQGMDCRGAGAELWR